jgi:uncharacterized membrane protein
MAKKVRRKLEEEEAASFEFPVFDEAGFVAKELEMTYGLVLASLIAILLGIMGWGLSVAGINSFVPFFLGLFALAASPYLIGRLRRHSSMYTRGDWAGLLALEFFGWLALWFVLQNVSPHAI